MTEDAQRALGWESRAAGASGHSTRPMKSRAWTAKEAGLRPGVQATQVPKVWEGVLGRGEERAPGPDTLGFCATKPAMFQKAQGNLALQTFLYTGPWDVSTDKNGSGQPPQGQGEASLSSPPQVTRHREEAEGPPEAPQTWPAPAPTPSAESQPTHLGAWALSARAVGAAEGTKPVLPRRPAAPHSVCGRQADTGARGPATHGGGIPQAYPRSRAGTSLDQAP